MSIFCIALQFVYLKTIDTVFGNHNGTKMRLPDNASYIFTTDRSASLYKNFVTFSYSILVVLSIKIRQSDNILN